MRDHWEDWPEGDRPDPIIWLWAVAAIVGSALLVSLIWT